jgi:Family of unknown function (DUF6152)
MRISAALVLGIGLAIASREAGAHHSFAAEFDAAKPFKLTGAVTKIEWQNPHAWLHMDVVDSETKKVTNWAVDVITVEGSLAKDGSPTGNARSVTTSAGQKLFAGSSQDATP